MTTFKQAVAKALKEHQLTYHIPADHHPPVAYITSNGKGAVPAVVQQEVRKIMPNRVNSKGWIIWYLNIDGDFFPFYKKHRQR